MEADGITTPFTTPLMRLAGASCRSVPTTAGTSAKSSRVVRLRHAPHHACNGEVGRQGAGGSDEVTNRGEGLFLFEPAQRRQRVSIRPRVDETQVGLLLLGDRSHSIGTSVYALNRFCMLMIAVAVVVVVSPSGLQRHGGTHSGPRVRPSETDRGNAERITRVLVDAAARFPR